MNESITSWLFIVVVVLAASALALAASALLMRWVGTSSTLRRQDRLRHWEQLAFELMAGVRSVEIVRAEVPSDHRLEFLELLVRLVQRVQGEDRRRLQSIGALIVDDARPGLSSTNDARRAFAVQAVGVFAPGDAAVAAALDDTAEIVAATAAFVIARHGFREELLDPKLDRFAHWDRRRLTALLAAPGLAAAPYLPTLLLDPSRPVPLRAAAAEALCRFSDPSATHAATVILDAGDHPEVESACLRLIGRVGSDAEADVAARHLDSTTPHVRIHALSAWTQLTDDPTESVIETALRDPSPWLARRAADRSSRRSA